MATCRDCTYFEVHVGYWICCSDGERRPRDLQELQIVGMENCSSFRSGI
ncbi:MAG: hypothetical protein ACLFVI_04465 [Archaeoglobaceae archaeon]